MYRKRKFWAIFQLIHLYWLETLFILYSVGQTGSSKTKFFNPKTDIRTLSQVRLSNISTTDANFWPFDKTAKSRQLNKKPMNFKSALKKGILRYLYRPRKSVEKPHFSSFSRVVSRGKGFLILIWVSFWGFPDALLTHSLSAVEKLFIKYYF